jgi:hypothetical protein
MSPRWRARGSSAWRERVAWCVTGGALAARDVMATGRVASNWVGQGRAAAEGALWGAAFGRGSTGRGGRALVGAHRQRAQWCGAYPRRGYSAVGTPHMRTAAHYGVCESENWRLRLSPLGEP